MDAGVVERLVETYFRRPFLYLVPLALCLLFGAYSALTAPKEYISSGLLNASGETLLSNLSGVDVQSSFGPTPASVAAERINEQLRSDEFVLTVADRAGLNTSLETGAITPTWMRQRVGASADGANLLRVGARTNDPVLSQRLATATIDAFVQSVIDQDLRQSAIAEEFYDDVAAGFDERVQSAEQELSAYLAENPPPAFGDRSTAELARINQLTEVLARAEQQQLQAQNKADEARLATEQARVDIEQRLRIIDPPTQPSAPVTGLRASAMTLITFGMLGTILTLGLVVVAAFLDRTLRSARELKSRLGFVTVADVPLVNFARRSRS